MPSSTYADKYIVSLISRAPRKWKLTSKKELVKWDVTTMEFAWREGVFKIEYFTFNRSDEHCEQFSLEKDAIKRKEPMDDFTTRLFTERGMRHSGNPDTVFLSSFWMEDKMRACAKPGRILVFTQRASLEIEYLGTVSSKQIYRWDSSASPHPPQTRIAT